MKFRLALVIAVAATAVPAHRMSGQAAGPAVTVAPSSLKVRPTDPPTSTTSMEIHAAQNEFEAAQLVVGGPATNVSVAVDVLTGPAGATIPAGNVRLYREAYVDVTTKSNAEGGTGRFPDALVPDVDSVDNQKRNAFPFDVPTGENRVIWLEAHVPIAQPPGDYSGTVTVSGNGFTVGVPITLRVWDFAIPSTNSIASYFGIGWNTACVAHYGNVPACQNDDSLIERTHLLYARFMLDHRVTIPVVYTGPKQGECTASGCDWSPFDALYGAFFDGTDPVLQLSGAKPTSIAYSWVGDELHYRWWAQHFRARGWFDRTFDYTCDEPPPGFGCPWSELVNRAAMVHRADADFPTLVTTTITNADAQGGTSSIDILTPVVNQMDDKAGPYAGNQRPRYDAFLTSDVRNRLWWYVSCMSQGCSQDATDPYFTGWPSMMIDNSAVQNRAQGILSWLYGVSGVLYYQIDLHLATAWNGGTLYDFGGNGDGTLLYPGTPAVIGGTTQIPVASVRLKMIRDGFEDYEFMKLVSDLGDPAFATQTGTNLFPHTYQSRQSAEALDAAREALAQRILALKGTPAPPSVTMSSPANGSTVSGVISVAANAFDPTGIAGVQFLLDGATVGTELTSTPYALSIDTGTLANGTHTFAARARNTSNVTSTSAPVSVTVNNGNASPQLTVTGTLSFSPAAPPVNSPVTATFIVTNTGNATVSISYFLVGGRNAANAHFDFPPSAPVTLQPGATYTYQAAQTFAAAGEYAVWPAWYDGVSWYELAPHTTLTVVNSATTTWTRLQQNAVSVTLGPETWSWNTGSDERASGASYISSSGGNSTLRLPFSGSAISVIGITDSCSGQARMDIDGSQWTIDAYRASGAEWQRTLFSASGLASSPHVLTITVLGTKQTASCGSWIYIDAFDVAGNTTTTPLQEDDGAVVQAPAAWSSGSDARASSGHYIASSTANSAVAVTFTGTGIAWIGMPDGCSGQATVSIDGSAAETIDAYRAGGSVWQQTVYVRGGLPLATHTMRLIVKGTKQPSSCGAWIYVDRFDVFP